MSGTISGGNPIIAAIISGTITDIGGGKFASGAKSAFFHALIGPRVEEMFGGSSNASTTGQGTTATQEAQANLTVDASVASQPSAFWQGVASVIGKIWALPNTLIGLVYGGVGHVVGMMMGTDPSISFGNNAIQFENNPFGGKGSITLGNAIVYVGSEKDPLKGNVLIGQHEQPHTYQSEILGPLYLPSNLIGGTLSLMFNSSWHGSVNWNETGPQRIPPSAW